jgi:threonine dehydrogenase-like Zn-dependent dehydrogenase
MGSRTQNPPKLLQGKTMTVGAVYVPTRKVDLIQLPEPTLTSPYEVLVKVQQVGLCAKDVKILDGLAGKAPSHSEHLIIGHEMLGRVVALGKRVQTLKLGDLVVPTVRRGCRVCESCLRGEEGSCYSSLYTERGIWEAQGFLSEYIAEEEANLIRVDLALENVAVLLEPMSMAVKALELARTAQQRLAVRCGHPEHAWDQSGWGHCQRALIAGVDAAGILAALWLRAAGGSVFVYANAAPESTLASELQAAGIEYLSSSTVPSKELSNWVGQADIVLDASGDAQICLSLLPSAARNGALVILDLPLGAAPADFDSAGLVRNLVSSNQVILGCVRSNRRHFEEGIPALERLRAAFPGLLPRLLNHRYPLSRLQDALEASSKASVKVLVEP